MTPTVGKLENFSTLRQKVENFETLTQKLENFNTKSENCVHVRSWMPRVRVLRAHLEEQVAHDAIVHDGAFRPLGQAVAVGVQRAALVVPPGEIIPD